MKDERKLRFPVRPSPHAVPRRGSLERRFIGSAAKFIVVAYKIGQQRHKDLPRRASQYQFHLLEMMGSEAFGRLRNRIWRLIGDFDEPGKS